MDSQTKNRCQAIANVSKRCACGVWEIDVTGYLCLSKPCAVRSFHSQKNEVRVVLCLQSLILSHDTSNSFPSPADAHKATARSQQESPQYHTITRRRSSWQASSGSTAAEPNPAPRDLQAHSWRPSWSKTAADKITPCTARQHGRGGLQREVKHERQCGCLGSKEEKALLTSSE